MDYPQNIELQYAQENTVHHDDSIEDKYPECIPRYFIEHFSMPKAKIFDPFLGHGTTAFVAEELGRIPYGIECDQNRFEWAAGQLEHWQNIQCADAADINDLGFPQIDLCITSPPFMALNHSWNPLSDGDESFAGYESYLGKLNIIFTALKSQIKRGGHVMVHVDNIYDGEVFTPLARDMSICISESFKAMGETFINFKDAPEEYPNTRVMIFKNT